ncbi:hypothetical protein THAOC_28040 [Thalassiosira oceanica]|uniref:Uncharacterized protein n=1 Tax=Thalassiosira oceanica TaxID=159749 RepID=K0RG22_THAOC|nr:hypothetical protein THAOC_28040 [Thalassiosira oceanica]|eukprot:EJK52663.1 hypothetical protein THAOC_28040 [Thalassiosira oceanica]
MSLHPEHHVAPDATPLGLERAALDDEDGVPRKNWAVGAGAGGAEGDGGGGGACPIFALRGRDPRRAGGLTADPADRGRDDDRCPQNLQARRRSWEEPAGATGNGAASACRFCALRGRLVWADGRWDEGGPKDSKTSA